MVSIYLSGIMFIILTNIHNLWSISDKRKYIRGWLSCTSAIDEWNIISENLLAHMYIYTFLPTTFISRSEKKWIWESNTDIFSDAPFCNSKCYLWIYWLIKKIREDKFCPWSNKHREWVRIFSKEIQLLTSENRICLYGIKRINKKSEWFMKITSFELIDLLISYRIWERTCNPVTCIGREK